MSPIYFILQNTEMFLMIFVTFCHIKGLCCYNIAEMEKKILTKIKEKMKIIIFFSNKNLDLQPTQPVISTP